MPEFARIIRIPAIVALLIAATVSMGQSDDSLGPISRSAARESEGEFHFVRLAYSENRFAAQGGRRAAWQTDWPDAEHHFL